MTNPAPLALRNPPIVEAVIDIDCDMPPNFDLSAAEERVHAALRAQYPEARRKLAHEAKFEFAAEQISSPTIQSAVEALLFLSRDGLQVVQVRSQGYSFNRLAPYEKLSDYLPEIGRTWAMIVGLCHPVITRSLRLRYINRFLLPEGVPYSDLSQYLVIVPQYPMNDRILVGESLQHLQIVDQETGTRGAVLLRVQQPENGRVPVILDIAVECEINETPPAWELISTKMATLRELKNQVFSTTLTATCLQLFR